MDFATLRKQRFDVASSMWNDSYWDEVKSEENSQITREQLRIFELENEYQMAKQATDELIAKDTKMVEGTEAKLSESMSWIEQFEKAISQRERRSKEARAAIEAESKDDTTTFDTAESVLRSRIQSSRQRLDSIAERLSHIGNTTLLRDARAQELLVQLRSLLSAQEKELRSLSKKKPAS